MDLDISAMRKAIQAYHNAPGGCEDGIRAAIAIYLTNTQLTSGELIVGESLPLQRDYRKELWIGVATAVANGLNAFRNGIAFDRANEALAAFDKVFPKENHHG